MVKRKSPRILVASALATLVVGLASCGTPQTLQPYTPAEGVNADVPAKGANADSGAVPLKVRNLMIVAQPGSNQGVLSGAIVAPKDRADQLQRVTGITFNAENQRGQQIQPVQANLDLPAGQMVVLTSGPTLQVSSPDLTPGLIAELTLTFAQSEAQVIRVPIVDATKPDYASMAPGAGGGAATPAATPAPGTPAATPATANTQPAPSPTPGG